MILGIAVLLFTAVGLWAVCRYLSQLETKPHVVVRVVAVMLIVCGVLFVTAIGTNAEKLAAAFGFFGTMIGYVMGEGRYRGSDPGG